MLSYSLASEMTGNTWQIHKVITINDPLWVLSTLMIQDMIGHFMIQTEVFGRFVFIYSPKPNQRMRIHE